VSGPFGETVVIHSRTLGTPDAEGNDTWTDTDTTLGGVSLYPRLSAEFVQGQDLNVIGLTAVFLPALVLRATDELTARGVRWAIDGEPAQYVSSLTGHTLTQVHLTRATG
jgi:hypothetical protein